MAQGPIRPLSAPVWRRMPPSPWRLTSIWKVKLCDSWMNLGRKAPMRKLLRTVWQIAHSAAWHSFQCHVKYGILLLYRIIAARAKAFRFGEFRPVAAWRSMFAFEKLLLRTNDQGDDGPRNGHRHFCHKAVTFMHGDGLGHILHSDHSRLLPSPLARRDPAPPAQATHRAARKQATRLHAPVSPCTPL